MVNPKIWGPHLWISLVNIVKEYPEHPTERDKQQYGSWLSLLGFVLPCAKCRKNYGEHLQEIPLQDYLGSRQELASWLHLVYNETLKDQGRPLIGFESFLTKFSGDRDDHYGKDHRGGISSVNLWLIILLLLVVIGYMYATQRKGTPLFSLMR